MSEDLALRDRDARIHLLWQRRPRDRFFRLSLALILAAAVGSWLFGDFAWSEFLTERRLQNLSRFLGEVRPYPLQGQPWSWAVAWAWGAELLDREGWEAARATLAISILAILLAGLAGFAFALPAARNFAAAEVFLPDGRPSTRFLRAFWTVTMRSTRVLLMLLRSIPEYVWAFLLLAIFGPSAWPAILALAIHNAGILGRLGSETLENADTQAAEAFRGLGAGRLQIAAFGLFPVLLPRLLLYFFYRWETCVREATVLGMLGIASLGFWVEDARTRGHYDTLVFLIGLGVAIVMLGDLLSALARLAVRRAS
jgi:phosphonate transport system permease protein